MKTKEQVQKEYDEVSKATIKAWDTFIAAEAPVNVLRNAWHNLSKEKERLQLILTFFEEFSSDGVAPVEEAVSSSKDVEGSFAIPSQQPSAVSEEKQQ